MGQTQTYQGDEVISEIQRRLKNLRVGIDTQVKIDESGDSLILTPVHSGIATDELKRILTDIDNRYGETFKSLAK